MPESFSVRLAKAEHVFSAAHFITCGGQCERLHGHNYHVAAELGGPLGADHLVVDFLVVRDAVRSICHELDHFVLLPTDSVQIRILDDGNAITATFEDRRWVFPRGDCRLLPVANTTAELLAQHIGRRLLALLAIKCDLRNLDLRIELDECDGQLGIWQCRAVDNDRPANFA
jgi:6-pyruvoyltetrahydropterin/6-carboxytetrahydropterin synthase